MHRCMPKALDSNNRLGRKSGRQDLGVKRPPLQHKSNCQPFVTVSFAPQCQTFRWSPHYPESRCRESTETNCIVDRKETSNAPLRTYQYF